MGGVPNQVHLDLGDVGVHPMSDRAMFRLIAVGVWLCVAGLVTLVFVKVFGGG